ncbi:hypothetical protein [Hydrogenivirga sp.]
MEIVRYLEAIKSEPKRWSKIVDKVLKDEEVITRDEAIAFLNVKPTSEDVK